MENMNKEKIFDFCNRLCAGIANTFGSNCETLIQDMSKPTHPILVIYNGHVSGRSVGSEMDIYGREGEFDETVFSGKDYIDNLVRTKDGRLIKSSTFSYIGADYHYALGINFDFTSLSIASNVLNEFTSVGTELDDEISGNAIVQIEDAFEKCLTLVGIPINKMDKSDRLYLVSLLDQMNAFNYQRSVPYVANKLNVSRNTIYKYLKEIEESPTL